MDVRMSEHREHDDGKGREKGPHRVGQVKEVTSLANPIVKDIKALAQKKTRDETKTFIAEGLKLVIDALELGWTIRTLVYAKAAKGKPAPPKAKTRRKAEKAGGPTDLKA